MLSVFQLDHWPYRTHKHQLVHPHSMHLIRLLGKYHGHKLNQTNWKHTFFVAHIFHGLWMKRGKMLRNFSYIDDNRWCDMWFIVNPSIVAIFCRPRTIHEWFNRFIIGRIWKLFPIDCITRTFTKLLYTIYLIAREIIIF